MGNDEALVFDTKKDNSRFKEGLDGTGNIAQKGLKMTGKVLEGTMTGLTILEKASIEVTSDFEAEAGLTEDEKANYAAMLGDQETMQGTAKDVIKKAQGMVQRQDVSNEGGFEELSGSFGDVAEELIMSLVTGILSYADEISTATIVLMGKLAEGIASVLPMVLQHGVDIALELVCSIAKIMPALVYFPSKQFEEEFGRWLMPGAMQGVKRSMPKALRDMKEQAGELIALLRGMVDASINAVAMNASGATGVRVLATAGTVVYNDNRQSQENNYHVPVASASEVNKAQRKAFRDLAGGVK